MASTNERTRTETKFQFALTHDDVLAMMNDPQVMLNGGDVSEDQVFSMVLKKANGTEILLKDLKPTDTLLFRFSVVEVANDDQDLSGIDVQG
jgi:hypothetical protein